MTKREHSEFTYEFENSAVPNIELSQYPGLEFNLDELVEYPDVEENEEIYYDFVPVPDQDVLIPVPDQDDLVPVPEQNVMNEVLENRK
jgi:hypothetical protein